jgi:hypothetical protein
MSVPQDGLLGRQLPYMRGKGLGGSTLNNFMGILRKSYLGLLPLLMVVQLISRGVWRTIIIGLSLLVMILGSGKILAGD